MIRAEHHYNPVEKEFLTLVSAIQKMQYYFVGQLIHCHLQSQSSVITHDKTLIAKLSIGKMGYITLTIQDAIYVTDSR